MIESIKLKEILGDEIREYKFGVTNVIIGPKGGGKSTLFDLLANASKQTILSSTIDALKNHDLELYSITIDGEEIHAASLNVVSIKKSSQKDAIYDLRNDVIYQDDKIKKNLSDSVEFDKAKLNFAKEIVETSEEINMFIAKLNRVHQAIANVTLMDETTTNFFNSFLIKEEVGVADEQLLFNLNYSTSEISSIIKGDKEALLTERENFRNQINFYKLTINMYESERKTLITDEYIETIVKLYKDLIVKYEEMVELNKKEIFKLKTKVKVINAFGSAYKQTVTNLKTKSEDSEKKSKRLQAYVSESTNHFVEMAKKIKVANASFDDFVLNQVGFEIDKTMPAGNLLDLQLKETIKFSEEQKYKYMKKVLYNAKKVQSHVANWIMSARVNGMKEFALRPLVNEMARTLKEEIKVTADGQDYETMSLGQKSIYGIKHKFNKSKGMPMFLDQPEDNLDNNTIATQVLDMINDKKEQMFIITHNANIGILSRPDRVIVGAMGKAGAEELDINQYKIGTIKPIPEDEENNSAFYLEGGVNKIKERLKIIQGDN